MSTHLERLHVQVARRMDAPALAALNQTVQQLHHDWSSAEYLVPDPRAAQEFFESRIGDPNSLVLVAERGGHPVGYLFAQEMHRPANPFTVEMRVLYVEQVAVLPERRRSGVGRALFHAAEAAAAKRGLDGVRLETAAQNAAAQRFFERLGYGAYSVRMKKDL
ncbi:MAG: N-acetyltransferase family protein [Candidatus Nanopelagicales bacterium]